MPITEAIGIDTGINTTGICYRLADGSEWTTSIERPKVSDQHAARMIEQVRRTVVGCLHPGAGLTVVATEKLFLKGDNAHSLSLEWAVIEGTFSAFGGVAATSSDPDEMRLVICRPAPSQLKKFVCDDGSMQKAGMGRHIERHWPQAPWSEDQGEAYALMQFARCRRQYERGVIDRETDGHHGEFCKYQVDMAARDLWSEAKSGMLHTLSLTGREVLELEDDFIDCVQQHERIEVPAEVAT